MTERMRTIMEARRRRQRRTTITAILALICGLIIGAGVMRIESCYAPSASIDPTEIRAVQCEVALMECEIQDELNRGD